MLMRIASAAAWTALGLIAAIAVVVLWALFERRK